MRKYSLIATILVVVCKGAFAIPVLQGTQTHPTGILGLTIGSSTYNATFSTLSDSYDSFYTASPITLISTDGEIIGDGPSPLVLAFADALAQLGVDGLGGSAILFPNLVNVPLGFLIPTSLSGGASSGQIIGAINPWLCCGHYYGFLNSESPNSDGANATALYEFVSFTQNVPEPDTLALLSLGLFGVPNVRRKFCQHLVQA